MKNPTHCPNCKRATLTSRFCPELAGSFLACRVCEWTDYDDRWATRPAPHAVEGADCAQY